MSGRARVYAVVGPTPPRPPDYARVARALSDADLEDEILGGKGGEDYQAALVAELDARARRGPPEPTVGPRPGFDSGDWDDAA